MKMTRRMMGLRACGLLMAAGLTGCGVVSRIAEPVTKPSGGTTLVRHISGDVHGGQQPISGAQVQLYAVGNTGLQSASTGLIHTTVVTSATGGFDITGLWDCNDTATYGADPLLYITAAGGDPGLGGGTNNAKIQMMAALGPCSTVNASTYISLNEVTTVATVYALAAFMQDSTHIGAAATAMTGLRNAFGTVNALVNTRTGFTPGPNIVAGETVPTAEIYTLANVIAACVNTNGTGACDSLFSSTGLATGPAVAGVDTSTAILSMVRNPTQNTTALFNLAGPTSPFQPVLATAPADWTMAVTFTGGGLSGPTAIAFDASGNAWVSNGTGDSVTGMSNHGALLTGDAGYVADESLIGAEGVAVDNSGNVWVVDSASNQLLKMTVSGGNVQSSTFYSAALNGPNGIAIDKQNHVWVTNFGDGTVSELTNNGVPMGASPLSGGGTLQAPVGIAIDAQGNAWVTDNQASVVAKFDANRNLVSANGFSDDGLVEPQGIAIDAAGRAWVAGNGNAGVSLFGTDGVPVTDDPVTGTGLDAPVAVAIDGAGVAWVSNSVELGSLTKVVSGNDTPQATLGLLNTPTGVAVDSSGNVWTANSGDDSVTKFVGLASPVVTPLAASTGP